MKLLLLIASILPTSRSFRDVRCTVVRERAFVRTTAAADLFHFHFWGKFYRHVGKRKEVAIIIVVTTKMTSPSHDEGTEHIESTHRSNSIVIAVVVVAHSFSMHIMFSFILVLKYHS